MVCLLHNTAIFGFLSVSLFTSAAIEANNSVFKLRSRSLVSGVKALMNDPGFTGLAKELYQHAAVSPRGPGGAQPLVRYPAYVDAQQFAGALLDITGLSAASAAAAAGAPGPQAIAALKAKLDEIGNPQLKQLLEGIVDRSVGDIKQVQGELAAWFDNGMDRVSGAFKRWTQLATFVIALLISFVVNVDSLRVATLLWEQPALAEQLKASAAMASGAKGDAKADVQAASELERTMQATLPVGWAPGHFLQVSNGAGGWTDMGVTNLMWSFFGWAVTAVAALFGAPFWFDTLQTVVRLKGAGPSPAEASERRAASR